MDEKQAVNNLNQAVINTDRSVIKLEQVNKQFEDTLAIEGMNLQIQEGRVYGLIGRNGAGKTTLLKLLAGQLNATTGTITYKEKINETEGKVAFARDFNYYFSNYKLRDLLSMAKQISKNWDKELEEELLADFELNVKKRYNAVSKGQQTMLSIVIALCQRPEVLLLDEPYAGLDPVNRETFYRVLRREYFNGENTVILSSHLITEIEGYFENAIIIDKGKILVNDEVEKIYEKSYLIECPTDQVGRFLAGKEIIQEEKMAGQSIVSVFDRLSDRDKADIQAAGGKIGRMDLQKLMIGLCHNKGGKRG